MPASASRRSRSSALRPDLVAAATRSSVHSESEERAVEAIEPASLPGVRAKATSSSAALASSTTLESPRYSAGGVVRLRRASTERMSPPRSLSQTASPVIRLEAARYQ